MESEGVEECAMESTSIYWIPIWCVTPYHLEDNTDYLAKKVDFHQYDTTSVRDTL